MLPRLTVAGGPQDRAPANERRLLQVRAADGSGELSVPTYELFAGTEILGAMAMERMGEIAGTASSLQGFVTTLGGALIGAAIGQAFDGSTVPLYAGFLLMSVIAFGIIAITEKGRMFRSS